MHTILYFHLYTHIFTYKTWNLYTNLIGNLPISYFTQGLVTFQVIARSSMIFVEISGHADLNFHVNYCTYVRFSFVIFRNECHSLISLLNITKYSNKLGAHNLNCKRAKFKWHLTYVQKCVIWTICYRSGVRDKEYSYVRLLKWKLCQTKNQRKNRK